MWSPWILLPAGAVVAMTGLAVWLQTANRAKRFTGETEGKILFVARSSHHSNGQTRHEYTPTVAYTVKGKRYEVKGQSVERANYYEQGARMRIRYDPAKPGKCLTVPLPDGKRSALVTVAVGVTLALLGVLLLLIGKES